MNETEIEERNFYSEINIKYKLLFNSGSICLVVYDRELGNKYYCRLCGELILIENDHEFHNYKLFDKNTAKLGRHMKIHSDKIEKLMVFR